MRKLVYKYNTAVMMHFNVYEFQSEIYYPILSVAFEGNMLHIARSERTQAIFFTAGHFYFIGH